MLQTSSINDRQCPKDCVRMDLPRHLPFRPFRVRGETSMRLWSRSLGVCYGNRPNSLSTIAVTAENMKLFDHPQDL